MKIDKNYSNHIIADEGKCFVNKDEDLEKVTYFTTEIWLGKNDLISNYKEVLISEIKEENENGNSN